MAAYTSGPYDPLSNTHGAPGGTSGNVTFDSVLGMVKKTMEIKPKKKIKITTTDSEEKVADTMVGFLKNKETELKTKLDTKSKEKAEVEAKIKDLIRKARTLQSTTGTLAKKYAETVSKNRSEVVEDYRKVITKIKLLEFIEKFEVDNKKRILFTTTPISIQKPDWDKEKVAGRYQVRIDFKKGNISEGIQGINIDQHYNEYDHPNLKSGKFCYGSKLSVDVEQEYREQDLYELVIDLVDLLRSPNDKDGWTRWGYFFQGAKKRAKGYSFQKFDQEDIETGLGTLEAAYPDFTTTYSSLTSPAGQVWAMDYGATSTYQPQRYGHFDDNQESITIHLLRLGFVDRRSAQYFTDRILHRTRGIFPDSIELRPVETRSNSDYELYYRFRYDRPVSLSMMEATAPSPEREMVDKLLVPANLIRPEGSAPAFDEEALQQMEVEMHAERRRMEREAMVQNQRLQNASEQMAQKMNDLTQAQQSALGVPQTEAPNYATSSELRRILDEEKIAP